MPTYKNLPLNLKEVSAKLAGKVEVVYIYAHAWMGAQTLTKVPFLSLKKKE